MTGHEPNSDDQLEALLRASYRDGEPPGPFVERLQGQLLHALAESPGGTAVVPQRNRLRFWNRMALYAKGFTMRQRLTVLGGVGAAALLGFLLSWNGLATRSASAMERMAEKIRQARSLKCSGEGQMTMTTQLSNSQEPRKSTQTTRMTTCWLAPDSLRTETTLKVDNGEEMATTIIVPGGDRPWLSINHRDKTFRFHPAHDQKWQMGFLPQRLAEFSGQAERDLGTKAIDGKPARGFLLNLQKLAPELSAAQPTEIWLDPQTNLPVAIHSETDSQHSFAADAKTTVTTTTKGTTDGNDFQWDVELDPKQFEATPPEGYRDLTLHAPTSGDPVEAIRTMLQQFAKSMGGHYVPLSQSVRAGELEAAIDAADATQSKLEREGGYTIGSETKKISPDKMAELRAHEAQRREGFLHLWALVNADRDVVYYGKTVTASDANKLLLRWRLDDGRYQVLYGDLRPEIVTAERLRQLEGK